METPRLGVQDRDEASSISTDLHAGLKTMVAHWELITKQYEQNKLAKGQQSAQPGDAAELDEGVNDPDQPHDTPTNSKPSEEDPHPSYAVVRQRMDSVEELYKHLKLFERLQSSARICALDYRKRLASLRDTTQQELARFEESVFPRFLELPTELRLLIWEFAVPQRVYNIMIPDRTVPAVAHVCLEARQVFLRLCTLSPNPLHQVQLTPINYEPWMFLNPTTSAAFLESIKTAIPEGSWCPKFVEVMAKVPELIIRVDWTTPMVLHMDPAAFHEYGRQYLDRRLSDAAWDNADQMADNLMEGSHLADLSPLSFLNKTLSLASQHTVQIARWGRPDLARDLFQDSEVLVVDLENRTEVQRVAGILKLYEEESKARSGAEDSEMRYRLDKRNYVACYHEVELETIFAIARGEGDWTRWGRARAIILDDLAAQLADFWFPSTDIDSPAVNQVAREMLTGTRIRLVAVLELVEELGEVRKFGFS